jgi:hypothetical protein
MVLSVKIRTAQIKPAPRAAQFTAVLFQFGRAIWTKSLGTTCDLPRAHGRLLQHLMSLNVLSFFSPATTVHPRNINRQTSRHKWEIKHEDCAVIGRFVDVFFRYGLVGNKIVILCFFHSWFCARITEHREQHQLAVDAVLGLPPGGSRCTGRILVP